MQSLIPLFHWHLEISSKCALACPRCPRTGDENKHKYQATQLALADIQKIFAPRFIAQNMKRLLLCGGQGDPIYNTEMIEIVRYFKTSNPSLRITIVTNGSFKSRDWWRQLASVMNTVDSIVFSVDGWDQESNRKYRVNSDFESIMLGIDEMVQNQIEVHWSTIIFKFNEDKLDLIQDLAKRMGVHYFHRVLSTKFDGFWRESNGIDPLKPSVSATRGHYDKNVIALNAKREPVRILDTHVNKNLRPRCLSGEQGIYVDASGILYPCCWVSHPYDQQTPKFEENTFVKNREQFDLKKNSLEQIFASEAMQDFFATFENVTKRYGECQNKCLAENVT